MKQTLGLTTTVFVDKVCVCVRVRERVSVGVKERERANGTLHFTIWSFSVLV